MHILVIFLPFVCILSVLFSLHVEKISIKKKKSMPLWLHLLVSLFKWIFFFFKRATNILAIPRDHKIFFEKYS